MATGIPPRPDVEDGPGAKTDDMEDMRFVYMAKGRSGM